MFQGLTGAYSWSKFHDILNKPKTLYISTEVPGWFNGYQKKSFALNAFHFEYNFHCGYTSKNFTPLTRTVPPGLLWMSFSVRVIKVSGGMLLHVIFGCKRGKTLTVPLIFSSFHCSMLNLPASLRKSIILWN